MLCEFGHFLGMGQIDGSVRLPFVHFSFAGLQSGLTKVVEGIDSYAYLEYNFSGLSFIHFLLLLLSTVIKYSFQKSVFSY
jgi:hypothetical protein